MGNLSAIYYAGQSLVDYLKHAYPETLSDENSCDFKFLGTGELHSAAPTTTTLALILYAVTVNEHSRNAIRQTGPAAGTVPLGVDLHLLLTVWTDNTFAEHSILGWAMREIHRTPLLDASILSADGDWAADDAIQMIPLDLRLEDLTRVWEALQQPYRLSVPYLARVVRIDVPPEPEARRVVTRRFTYTDHPNGADQP